MERPKKIINIEEVYKKAGKRTERQKAKIKNPPGNEFYKRVEDQLGLTPEELATELLRMHGPYLKPLD